MILSFRVSDSKPTKPLTSSRSEIRCSRKRGFFVYFFFLSSSVFLRKGILKRSKTTFKSSFLLLFKKKFASIGFLVAKIYGLKVGPWGKVGGPHLQKCLNPLLVGINASRIDDISENTSNSSIFATTGSLTEKFCTHTSFHRLYRNIIV